MVVGTDGMFSSDNEDRRRLGFNRNRVMPQTDIEYERDQLSNVPKHKMFSDDENSLGRQNARYYVKSNRTHITNSNMQIYEDGVGPSRPLSISTIGGGGDEPSLVMPHNVDLTKMS